MLALNLGKIRTAKDRIEQVYEAAVLEGAFAAIDGIRDYQVVASVSLVTIAKPGRQTSSKVNSRLARTGEGPIWHRSTSWLRFSPAAFTTGLVRSELN